MMKKILVVSAVSMAAISLNVYAHDEKETAQPAKTAMPPHAHDKGHSHAAGQPNHQTSAMGEEDHASALGKPGDAAKVTRTVQVEMNDKMHFNPSQISVTRGETIRFVVNNSGKLKHEMVLGSMEELKEHAQMMRKMPEMEHADENMVTVESGKSGQLVWQFTKAGKFDFACLQPGHFEAGMKGNVAVK